MTAQTDALTLIFSLAVLILSIIIHEVAHGYAANALGDPTAKLAGRLTLNPIPHIDVVGSILVPLFLVFTGSGVMFGWAKPVPYNPYNLSNQRWGEAIVAGAGVVTNLLIAIIFGLIARFGAGHVADPVIVISEAICFINLFLGLFNIIPIPPLDGYTLLRGLLPYRASAWMRDLEDRIRSGGFVTLIIVLVVFSVFFAGPFSILVQWLFGLLVGGAS